MAHGDYNCCAICDCKLAYNSFDAQTKEEICTDCLMGLRKEGLNILTVDELIDWMQKEDKVKLLTILHNINFHFCYYTENRVDKLFNTLMEQK